MGWIRNRSCGLSLPLLFYLYKISECIIARAWHTFAGASRMSRCVGTASRNRNCVQQYWMQRGNWNFYALQWCGIYIRAMRNETAARQRNKTRIQVLLISQRTCTCSVYVYINGLSCWAGWTCSLTSSAQEKTRWESVKAFIYFSSSSSTFQFFKRHKSAIHPLAILKCKWMVCLYA